MNEKGKRHINALDIILILLIVLVIVAFFFRSEIQNLFAKKGDATLTFSFRLDQADERVAAQFGSGTVLKDGDGNEIGTILDAKAEKAVSVETLADGTKVEVANGKTTVTGNVTAKGYVSGDFQYLNNGVMLVAGDTMFVSTGSAYVEIEILFAQSQ